MSIASNVPSSQVMSLPEGGYSHVKTYVDVSKNVGQFLFFFLFCKKFMKLGPIFHEKNPYLETMGLIFKIFRENSKNFVCFCGKIWYLFFGKSLSMGMLLLFLLFWKITPKHGHGSAGGTSLTNPNLSTPHESFTV